ncbi:hypothetical protein QBC42DRAFT_331053 [Cladorrhinum samala]|uniref:Uncharacterized protein n=1 Tax=Cladorrhinum samala TaxID=585594 RepID=A0AAV9HJU9_9PEZI|nr:hypothetical protein QBC42DRAFT_331053 [Cladorrhinum samala]
MGRPHHDIHPQGSARQPIPPPPSQAGQERWRLQIGRYEPRNDNIVNILSDYVVQFAARTPPGYDSTHLVDRQEAIDTPFQVSTRYLERKSLQSLRLEAGRPSEASDGLSVPRSSHPRPPMSDNIIDNACEDNTRARIPLAEISFSKSLKTLASDIRAATQAVDAAAVHRFIGCVNTLGAVTNLTRKLNLFPGPDLGVTDISGLDILRADWGGGMYGQAGSHPPSYQRE